MYKQVDKGNPGKEMDKGMGIGTKSREWRMDGRPNKVIMGNGKSMELGKG